MRSSEGMQQHSLWQAVLGEIELSISRGNFITWFKNTTLLRHEEDAFVIGVPNVFIKQQLERKYNQLIMDTLKKNGVAPIKVEYKIHSALTRPTTEEDAPVLANANQNPNKIQMAAPRAQSNKLAHTYRQGLNERYTFDNFIVGSGNELA